MQRKSVMCVVALTLTVLYAAGASAMADLAAKTDRAFRAGGGVAAREVLVQIDDVWPRTRDALRAAIG